jgi:hypothetical protein
MLDIKARVMPLLFLEYNTLLIHNKLCQNEQMGLWLFHLRTVKSFDSCKSLLQVGCRACPTVIKDIVEYLSR